MASTLSRAELQQLAKQHGIKANMKNAEIEAALLEKGALPSNKKKGLSVRDSNAQPIVVETVAKTTKRTAEPVKAEVTEKATEEPADPISKGVEDAAAGPARRTRRSASKAADNETLAAAQSSENTPIVQESKPEANPEELPLAARRGRRSAAAKGEEQPAMDASQPPLAQRRSLRSTGDVEEAPVQKPKRTSRAKVSSSVTEEEVVKSDQQLAVQGTTEDLEEKPQVAVFEATAPLESTTEDSEAKELASKPKRVSASQQYESRRRSKERDTILSEIAKEMEIADVSNQPQPPMVESVFSTTAQGTPKIAQNNVPIVDRETKEYQTDDVTNALQNDLTATTDGPAVTVMPPQTPATVSTVVSFEESKKSNQKLLTGAVARIATPMAETASASNKENSPLVTSTASQQQKPSVGKPIRMIRKVAVPDLPPTPEVTHNELENVLLKEADSTSKNPLEAPSTGTDAPTEAPSDATASTIAPKSTSIVVPRKIKKLDVPDVPATPEAVKAERQEEERILQEKGKVDIEHMRAKVMGALEALDTLHSHLVEQKRLREALEATREENKRLRAALMMDD